MKQDINEIIKVISAFKDGKPIQTRIKGKSWADCKEPTWNFAYQEYRIKPKPSTLPEICARHGLKVGDKVEIKDEKDRYVYISKLESKYIELQYYYKEYYDNPNYDYDLSYPFDNFIDLLKSGKIQKLVKSERNMTPAEILAKCPDWKILHNEEYKIHYISKRGVSIARKSHGLVEVLLLKEFCNKYVDSDGNPFKVPTEQWEVVQWKEAE